MYADLLADQLQMELLRIGYGSGISRLKSPQGDDIYVCVMDFDRRMIGQRLGIRAPVLHDIRIQYLDGTFLIDQTPANDSLSDRERQAAAQIKQELVSRIAAVLGVAAPKQQAETTAKEAKPEAIRKTFRATLGFGFN